MRLNDALEILVIGMIFEILILIFIVVFVINAKIWVIESFNNCISRIKDIEEEMGDIEKVNLSIKEIKETLNKVEKILK